MATLHLTSSPSLTLIKPRKGTNVPPAVNLNFPWSRGPSNRQLSCIVQSYKVLVEHEGKTTELEVDSDETILSKALDSGLSVPHDCKLGVCMTCPAKLLSGKVDQSEGMLSDDVVERGWLGIPRQFGPNSLIVAAESEFRNGVFPCCPGCNHL